MAPSLKPHSIIYIACPANYATGGTELIHQLANKLNALGRKAFIYYFNYKEKNPIHPRFVEYNVPFVKHIDENKDNLLIVPEGKTNLLENFSTIQKAVWWLSIDFYFHTRNEKVFWFIRKKIKPIENLAEMSEKYGVNYHFVQSYYAADFLKKFNLESHLLSDYLNKKFLTDASTISFQGRQDRVLYNPKKGLEFTTKLMQAAPNINWVPLQNLTVAEVAELCKTSKVYIDFGNHPGKDRFPREAAAMGCIVITNKQGAAAFREDLPIPDKYKFENGKTGPILDLINECMARFEKYAGDFDSYRTFIHKEEEMFTEQIKSLFL